MASVSAATGELPAAAAPATTARAGRGRRRRYSPRDKLVLGAMIGVPIVIDLIFVWGPALFSVGLSFTRWNGVGGLHARACLPPPTPSIVNNGCIYGIQNYKQAATVYPEFWPAVRHNITWLLVFLFVATPLGVLIAVLLDRNIRGSRIYQSVIFLPVMLSLALIGIIWEFVYSSNYGLINTVIGRTSNANAIDWLGNPRLNLPAVLVEACWRQVGYVMVLYLAGLKAVDPTLREAAQMDGASAWQTFRRVTFPVMRPINIVVLVVTVIESLRAFDLVYITNKGINGLELLSVLVTANIVGETQRIGFGSSLGVVLLVISLVPITIFLYQTFHTEERS
ncbi:MAG: binding-protein-dependent transport system inner rane component [Frankiales bacterium]|nr:binding-protein-dependent transport system inner rane component [Frankiales bacterium]